MSDEDDNNQKLADSLTGQLKALLDKLSSASNSVSELETIKEQAMRLVSSIPANIRSLNLDSLLTTIQQTADQLIVREEQINEAKRQEAQQQPYPPSPVEIKIWNILTAAEKNYLAHIDPKEEFKVIMRDPDGKALHNPDGSPMIQKDVTIIGSKVRESGARIMEYVHRKGKDSPVDTGQMSDDLNNLESHKIDTLSKAQSEGKLTPEEFEKRAKQVYEIFNGARHQVKKVEEEIQSFEKAQAAAAIAPENSDAARMSNAVLQNQAQILKGAENELKTQLHTVIDDALLEGANTPAQKTQSTPSLDATWTPDHASSLTPLTTPIPLEAAPLLLR